MLPEIQTPNQAILYGQRYSTHQKDYIYMTVSIIKQYYMVNGTVHTRKIIYIYIYIYRIRLETRTRNRYAVKACRVGGRQG
jgi:hypothetical protein